MSTFRTCHDVSPMEARQTWLDLCDEASDTLGFRREDFDPDAMSIADTFAAFFDLPKFDLVADIDKAYMILEEWEMPCDVCGERMKLGHDQAEVTRLPYGSSRSMVVHQDCMGPDMVIA